MIDIFAGPGGLGEGFSSFEASPGSGRHPFELAVSAEMEPSAHSTLRLRAFYRLLTREEGRVPPEYLGYLELVASGENESPAVHFSSGKWKALWEEAEREALNLTLGVDQHNRILNDRIAAERSKYDELILIGGPPCQAYSLVGRARQKNVKGFRTKGDTRHFLYKQYLGILADFSPAVFIMENVKGILTSKVGNREMFGAIMRDLEDPSAALASSFHQGTSRQRYVLLPIHVNEGKRTSELVAKDPAGFIIRCENHGVGNIDQSFSAVAYTSRAYDFTKPRADGLGIPIGSLSQPAIFVIKKNKSILTNLIEWLRSTSSAGDVLTMPILVIDDEADNASINTSKDPSLPNTINSLIRQLLASSTRNTYIGFTATPFANIFVDPENDDELHKEDLFPRAFIIGLDAPSNYVGPVDYFLDDKESGQNLSVLLEDAEEWLPVKHKIDVQIDSLPESLEDAINCFLVSKAIRILRGQGGKHHSMLVNVSRFTGVQGRVASLISQRMGIVAAAIENRHRLSESIALRDPTMKSLHESWFEHYGSSTDESWGNIQKALHQAAASVHVVEVNARSGPGTLDYRRYADIGLNVIAVGGNSLSRGFTLEGLTVSYFLRNTQMYDTLLQMGRWFGYRDGYKDLCRLFIKSDAFDWYAYIASASEELRDEIAKMERYGLRPIDFGLAVRSHPGSLIVTARNKMRTAKEIVRKVGLAARLVESSLVVARGEAVGGNWERSGTFIRRLAESGLPRLPLREDPGPKASTVFQDVPQDQVLEFIGGFVLPPGNPEMAATPLIDYATRRGFELWDVLVASNTRADEASTINIAGIKVGLQARAANVRGAGAHTALSVSKNKRRVASRGQEAAGLTPSHRKAVEEAWRLEKGDASIPDRMYREVRQRPLLMIHLLDMQVEQPEGNSPKSERHAAYGISFPGLQEGQVEQKVVYTANVIAFREMYGDPDAEGDDDDDESQD